jgi:hypothetical protein
VSSFSEEMVTLLVGSGVATSATIFTSSRAFNPDLAALKATDSFLILTETGGFSPIRTQNSVILPAYQQPGAQLVAKAKSVATARARARLAYNMLVGIKNISINGTYYREINPNQEPFDLGLDANGLAQFAFNFYAIKRPSS